MPVSYKFCRADGESEFLSTVDNELRIALGLPPDETKNCLQFDILTYIGIAAANGPKGEVTKESCAKYFTGDHGCNEREIAVYTDFLCGRYTFYAWR